MTGGLSTVPEPTTVALLGTGRLFLVGVACKQRRPRLRAARPKPGQFSTLDQIIMFGSEHACGTIRNRRL